MHVIQVGIGGMGSTWLRTVQASNTVTYAGLVEISPEIAAQQAQAFNLDETRIYRTLDDALAAIPRDEIDAVIDVTPPQFHRAIASTALHAGLPVLSEKPLAHTFDDARALADIARDTGTLLMVAQNYRYRPAIQTLKSVLDSGELGAIGAVSVDFYKGPHFGGFRDEMDYPLVIDMAIHHFDLMRYLLGSDAVSLFGRSWNPPWSWYKGDAAASLSLRFTNDVVVSYDGSWCAQGRETSWNGDWRFDCAGGVVTLVDDAVTVQRLTGVDGFNNRYSEPEIIAPVVMPRQGQDYLLHAFYTAVTAGTLPETTAADHIKSLAIVFRCLESFESGAAVGF